MTKIIRLLTLATCIYFLPLFVGQAQERVFGYITPNNETDLKTIGSTDAGYCGPGIAIGEETGHLGSTIRKVRFYLTLLENTKPESYDTNLYIYDQASRTFVYNQPTKNIHSGWNEVELTTPYTIAQGDNLVVGYMLQLPEHAYVLGVDTRSPAVEEGSYFYYHNVKNMRNTAAQGVGNNAIELVVTPSKELANAPQVYPFIGKFVGLKYGNQSAPLHAFVRNTGTEAVHSVELSYTSEDKKNQLVQADVTIEPGEYKWISIPVLLQREGKSKFSITAVNHQANSAKSKEYTVRVSDLVAKTAGVQRSVLAETFVSERYKYLPEYLNGISVIQQEAEKYGFKIHRVSYHLKDGYTTPHATQWAKAIKLDTLAAMSVDRIPALGFQWMYVSRGYYEMLNQLAKPTPFTLEGSVTKNPNEDEISLAITVRAVGTLPEDRDIRLTLVMVQDQLPPLLPELQTLPPHQAVYRCHLTPPEGIPVKISAEAPEFRHTQTFRSHSLWKGNKENVSVIAFVSQNSNNTNVWERNVYHTIAIPMGNILASQPILPSQEDYKIYIDGGYIRTDKPLPHNGYRLYNMQGAQVAEPLQQGTYIISLVEEGGELRTYKLTY